MTALVARNGGTARVVAVHRYFWPDTPPYASLLRLLAAHWAARGVDVTVLSAQPGYQPELDLGRRPRRERLDGFAVERVGVGPERGAGWRRPLISLWFTLRVAWRLLTGPRADVVMCSTAPPVVLARAVSAVARRRGAAFVYHCMDLHPEIGRVSGDFSRPLVHDVLMRLDLATCRSAAAIVVLSDDMRRALLERDPALDERIVVVNNVDLPSFDEPGQPAAAPFVRDDRLTVCFTGNLGRFQGLEEIASAVLGLDDVRLVLMGEGAARPALEALAQGSAGDRITLLPHGSPAAARAVMREADLGLVSLVPGVIAYAYPSKTMAYLAEGLPVLAAVEADSGLVRDLVGRGAGVHLPRGVDEVRARLRDLATHRDDVRAMRASALEAWRSDFSAEARLADWDALLDRLVHPVGVPA